LFEPKAHGHLHDYRICDAGIGTAKRTTLRVEFWWDKIGERLSATAHLPVYDHLRTGVPTRHVEALRNQFHAGYFVLGHVASPDSFEEDCWSTV
jgi:hypothetical protein